MTARKQRTRRKPSGQLIDVTRVPRSARSFSRSACICIRFACLITFVASCVTGPTFVISQYAVPETLLDDLRIFHVFTRENDRGIGEMIGQQLRSRNRQVGMGEAPTVPPSVEVVVVYHDRWGLHNFVLQIEGLKIDLRDPGTNVLIATATSQRPVTPIMPREMVAEVVHALFRPPPKFEAGD